MQNFSQNQSLSQSQKLSQTMIQNIGLLSDSTDQLWDKIYAEVEKNPALEIISDVSPKAKRKSNFENSYETEREVSRQNKKSDDFQAFLESSEDSGDTLQQHLMIQLNVLKLTDEEKEIGKLIISNLDEKGYHVEAIESLFPEKERYQKACKVLALIQEFDPVGVCCKNIQESLYLQAKERGADAFTLDFLLNHFDLLNKPRTSSIQKQLSEYGIKASGEQIENLINFIRTLEPFPARMYESDRTRYISPDVKVSRVNDEKGINFKVELIKTNIPELRLNEDMLKYQGENESIKKFVSNASNFLNAIEVRNQTLLKAAVQIVAEQKEFFEKGPGSIKPLRMKDLAEKIDVHETTVSRIANEKYLMCDWGLFEFKYFFSNEVNVAAKSAENSDTSAEGKETLSKEAIKHILAQIIEENDKAGNKALSDQKLTDRLSEKGINIARRTVAKYRKELNLNSSYDR
ncbi:MAG: RNA polymerase factor sigma-54 [Treponemataceae bacterium]|nr:RNA polymerase factor sigma-54 [Treponemataceae bacterium]